MRSIIKSLFDLLKRFNFQSFVIMIFITTASTSCVTYKVSSFQTKDPIAEKIPNLLLKGIEYNMETFYAPKVVRTCKNDSLYMPAFNIPASDMDKEISSTEAGIRLRGKNYEDTTYLNSWYNEMFIGKKKDFQEKLISERKFIPLNEIASVSSYYNSDSLNRIFLGSCPSYAPYGSIGYKYNLRELGYINNTLPDLISDVCSICSYEFSENICRNSDVKGYAVIKLLSGVNKNSGLSLIFLSGITLYSLSFLGFPMVVQTNDIEVGLDIYSLNNQRIASYSSHVKSSASSAMYWGYPLLGARVCNSNYQLPRATNSKAIHRALSEIKNQISSDSKKINAELLKGY